MRHVQSDVIEKKGKVNQLWLGWVDGSFSAAKMNMVSTGQERRERNAGRCKYVCAKAPRCEKKSKKFSVSRMRRNGVNV